MYAVTPEGRYVWGGYYEPGTLIWRSRWIAEHAVIECREALALPTTPDRAVILRRIEAIRGTARVVVQLNPRSDFGRRPARALTRGGDGNWRLQLDGCRACWSAGPGVRTRSDGRGGQALGLALTLPEGQRHDLVLVVARSDADEVQDAGRAWEATEAEWRSRVPELDLGVAKRDAQHSYAVLTGLTSDGGGMVASATTSLPERYLQGRNYDYRYVWIRDQCYAGEAAAALGPDRLLDGAVRFVAQRLLADGPDLKPAYTVAGRPVPRPRALHLPGYPGGSDIIGNAASDQFQLDAFGEALLLFSAAAGWDRLDSDAWQAAEIAASAIEQRWREPDAGIWELEGRRWTHSRLVCAAGLRAISRHCPAGEGATRWLALADTITADASSRALHPSGRWQRADGDERVDASLLVAGIRGAVPATDPRTSLTLRACLDELTEDGFAYRYRPDERPLGEAEGSFLLCGFLVSLALLQQGDVEGAARWFERNRGAGGPPGLLAEEFDVGQRQLRGNLPQAFVHALLLECAVRQDRSRAAGPYEGASGLEV
jgi:GH15 family glucan-1,4-alpha-glucosidase